jgi:cytochrome c-type biogenesis protein
MANISLILAFSAGLLSFLSPCVLPLVPAYISYLTGTTVDDSKNKKSNLFVLYKSIGFVAGFSIIFIIMGASITSIGKVLINNQSTFRRIAGSLIFIFGLHTTGILRIRWFYYEKRLFSFSQTGGILGAILMGMSFAAGWTPCIGPILSSILVYASSMETISRGIILLTAYSLGLAVPFILTALAIESLSSKISRLGKYLSWISILSGSIMILMGILVFTNKIGIISQYLNFVNF